MFHRLKSFLIILVTAGFFLAVLHQPLLSTLGNLVIYESDNFERADVVVVPSGAIPGRAFEAADLILEAKADRAILMREQLPISYEKLRDLNIDYLNDHEINNAILLKLGIDAAKIHVLPEENSSTWEEALSFRNYADQNSVRSIVITTCQFHSYRAHLNFKKALEGTGIQIHSVPSKYCEFKTDTWWKDREQVKRLYLELANLAVFFLGKR